MTSPEHLTHFWGPAGTSTPIDGITVDLRPGGVFETVMVNDADGGRHTMRAEYLEVVPPARLVWRESSGMVTTITFADLGDGTTEVVTRQTQVPESFRDAVARRGFATSLDRFDAYVAARMTTD
jgi:uncharacterized protein YndB with AHSA1/START domain